jgi:hypothetical protein
MNTKKLNRKTGRKAPPLVLRLPVPVDGVARPLEKDGFTVLKQQRLSARRRMPVTRWIKGSWSQPIKKLEVKI